VREHRLRDGDLIAVGHHQMRFTGPSAKPRATSVEEQTAESDTTLVAARPEALERTTPH
jgi:hypothetical protein